MHQIMKLVRFSNKSLASQFVVQRVDHRRELLRPRELHFFERPHCAMMRSCTIDFAKEEAGAMKFRFAPARSSSSKSTPTPGNGATFTAGCSVCAGRSSLRLSGHFTLG